MMTKTKRMNASSTTILLTPNIKLVLIDAAATETQKKDCEKMMVTTKFFETQLEQIKLNHKEVKAAWFSVTPELKPTVQMMMMMEPPRSGAAPPPTRLWRGGASAQESC